MGHKKVQKEKRKETEKSESLIEKYFSKPKNTFSFQVPWKIYQNVYNTGDKIPQNSKKEKFQRSEIIDFDVFAVKGSLKIVI